MYVTSFNNSKRKKNQAKQENLPYYKVFMHSLSFSNGYTKLLESLNLHILTLDQNSSWMC